MSGANKRSLAAITLVFTAACGASRATSAGPDAALSDGAVHDARTRDAAGTDARAGAAGAWLTAYFPSWSTIAPAGFDFSGLTHIVHFGAKPIQTAPYFSTTDIEPQRAALLSAAHAAGAHVLLSVGGVYGEQSTSMEFVMSDDARARQFATAALTYAHDNGYDGIEIDYEPIWNVAAGTKLLTMTKVAGLLSRGPSGNDGVRSWSPRGTLALAVGNGRAMYADEVIAEADQLNFMLYDMATVAGGYCNPGDGCPQDVTGYNAPLHTPTASPVLAQYSKTYDTSNLHDWLASGVSPTKLAAGLPLYGYIFLGKSAPGQPSGGAPHYLGRTEVSKALARGGKRFWDDGAKVPWLGGVATAPFNNWEWTVAAGSSFYITYDDSQSLTEKVHWAKSLGLGGLMLYDLESGRDSSGAQPSDALLAAVRTAFRANFGSP